MNWEATTVWESPERYEIRMIRPTLWIVYGPDGWVDAADSMGEARDKASKHITEHPNVAL